MLPRLALLAGVASVVAQPDRDYVLYSNKFGAPEGQLEGCWKAAAGQPSNVVLKVRRKATCNNWTYCGDKSSKKTARWGITVQSTTLTKTGMTGRLQITGETLHNTTPRHTTAKHPSTHNTTQVTTFTGLRIESDLRGWVLMGHWLPSSQYAPKRQASGQSTNRWRPTAQDPSQAKDKSEA